MHRTLEEALALRAGYTDKLKGLVGIPFVDGGRNPAVGLDCWGLVMAVGKRYGLTFPDFTVGAFSYATIAVLADQQKRSLTWTRILEPMDYDMPLVVLMRMHRHYITHAGVFVGNGRIMHTTEATNVVITPMEMLQGAMEGYYRYVPNH